MVPWRCLIDPLFLEPQTETAMPINLNEAAPYRSLDDLEAKEALQAKGRFVVTSEAEAAIHGHEHELVRAAGVNLPAIENEHTTCPYPDHHPDRTASFRL